MEEEELLPSNKTSLTFFQNSPLGIYETNLEHTANML